MDLNMPGMSGAEAALDRAVLPDVPVVMLSVSSEESDVADAIMA